MQQLVGFGFVRGGYRVFGSGLAALVITVLGAPQAGAAPAGLTLQSVTVNSPPSTFSPTWEYGENPGGTATWNVPTFINHYSFPIPSSIPSGGVTITLKIEADVKESAPPNTSSVPAEGINSPLVSGGYVAVNTTACGKCGPGYETPNPNKTEQAVTLTPTGSSPVTLQVGLQDGPTFTYTYVAKAAPPPPPSPPEVPPVIVPAPAAWGVPVFGVAGPGAAALFTSPPLSPNTREVSVDVGGLSVEDQGVLASLRHQCYVNFSHKLHLRTVLLLLKATEKKVAEKNFDADKVTALDEGEVERARLAAVAESLTELVDCVRFVDALTGAVLAKGAAASMARTMCAVTPVDLSISGSGANARLRSFHPAKPNSNGLRVRCTRHAAGLRISIASDRSSLRSVVGPRLSFAILRGPKDPATGQLRAVFHRH